MTSSKDTRIKKLEQRIRHLEGKKSAGIGITKYDVFRFLCFAGSGIMTYLSIFFLFYSREFLGVGIFILFPVLLVYLFVSLTAISGVALHKGGFSKLKPWNREGLIFRLIVGLIFGLIVGLIFGLIFGLIYGLIYGMIFRLIVGLIFGLIFGLMFGLILGLIEEYGWV